MSRKLVTSVPQLLLTCSVCLHGLKPNGWVAVIPNHFHFVIIPLTADCGIFAVETFHNWTLCTGFIYHSATLEFSEPTILPRMFVEAVCMTGWRILSRTGCWDWCKNREKIQQRSDKWLTAMCEDKCGLKMRVWEKGSKWWWNEDSTSIEAKGLN